jgi:hypothetical protein
VSISSSLAEGVASPGLLAASFRAEPNPLPNIEPPDEAAGFSFESFWKGSALNEEFSLNGVDDANGFATGLSGLAEKAEAVSVDFAGVPKELAPKVLPLPNPPLELLLVPPSDAKPPCEEKAENPLPVDAGAADGAGEPAAPDELVVEAAVPKGLWLLPPLAKLEKPDWPKEGFDPAPDAHGDVLMPSCDD